MREAYGNDTGDEPYLKRTKDFINASERLESEAEYQLSSPEVTGKQARVYSHKISHDRRHRLIRSAKPQKKDLNIEDKVSQSRPEPHLPQTQQWLQDKQQRLLLHKKI